MKVITEDDIILRTASMSDLELLSYWDRQPHIVAADPNDDWNWQVELLRHPAWREQLIAELNGRPIGFLQIIDPALEETHYWGEIGLNFRAIDIWIGEENDLGKGYGTSMMRLAVNRCFNDGKVIGIFIDPLESNTKAHRFYEGLGFQFIEKKRFAEDDCFVYYLSRNNWTAHNQEIK